MSIFRCDGRYNLTIYEPDLEPGWIKPYNIHSSYETSRNYYGTISGISPDKIAYATQASEAAFIVDKVTTEDVKCEILPVNFNHTDDNLYVAFSEGNFMKLKHMLKMKTKDVYKMHTIDVEFEVKHMFFNSLISAVNLIPQHILPRILPTAKEFLQPTYPTVHESYMFIDHIVDVKDEHNLVLKKVAYCHNMTPPVLVTGPFGTGKTRLLATAAHFFIMYGKHYGKKTLILVGAHHQASADQLLECFCQIALERNIETDWASVFRVASFRYKNQDSKYQGFYKNGWQVLKYIQQYKHSRPLLVITTFHTSIQLRRQLNQICFTHILLDEGSQAREPEAIAPLCLASPFTKIVIAGDSFQVIDLSCLELHVLIHFSPIVYSF